MADQPLDASTRLAAERTRLAQERTLMAWIRTCTSLIAFGFTIYQFFLYLSTNERLRQPIVTPQVFGVLMILVGLIGQALPFGLCEPGLSGWPSVSGQREPAIRLGFPRSCWRWRFGRGFAKALGGAPFSVILGGLRLASRRNRPGAPAARRRVITGWPRPIHLLRRVLLPPGR